MPTGQNNKSKTSSKTKKREVKSKIQQIDIPVSNIDVGSIYKDQISYKEPIKPLEIDEVVEDNVDLAGNVYVTYSDILQEMYTSPDIKGSFSFDPQKIDALVSRIISGSSPKYEEDSSSSPNTDPNINTNGGPLGEIKDDENIQNENYTDPVVIFGPQIEVSHIAVSKGSAPDNIQEDGTINTDGVNMSPTEDYPIFEMGIVYPLLNINNYIPEKQDIAYMILKCDEFLPTIEVALYLNGSGDIHKFSTVDTSSLITVILRPHIDGKYKDISLDFGFIKSEEDKYNDKNIIIYTGKYLPNRTINGKQVFESLYEQKNCCLKRITNTLPTNNTQTPFKVIKRGDKGNEVKQIQNKLGVKPADSNFGKITEAAVKKFQKEHGLNEDGQVGKATWNAIFNISESNNSSSSTTSSVNNTKQNTQEQTQSKANPPKYKYPGKVLDKNSKDTYNIKLIQQQLGINQTGIYDENTINKVKEFQKKNNLGQDGKVGQATWKELFSKTVTETSTPPTFPEILFVKGMEGENIKKIQQRLGIPVTGKFDDKTEQTVKNIQIANDLQPVDGKVGKPTWDVIFGIKSSYGQSITDEPEEIINTPSDPYIINAYESLYYIAHNTGLGFASSNKCIDNGFSPRLMENRTYETFIQNDIMKYDGDDNHVYECWVDLYNTLTVVNLKWIFDQSKNITPKNLTTYACVGLGITDENGKSHNWVKTYRTLTNAKEPTISDMMFFSMYFTEVDKSNEYGKMGAINNVFSFNPQATSINGMNSFEKQTIWNIPPSINALINTPRYTLNMSDEACVNMNIYNSINPYIQEQINSRYKITKRLLTYTLTLTTINFGLNRGMLINLLYFETQAHKKAIILNNIQTRLDTESVGDNVDLRFPSGYTKDEIMEDPDYPLPDVSKSGIFYIDKMIIEYNKRCEGLSQSFSLIKLGDIKSYKITDMPTWEIDESVEDLTENNDSYGFIGDDYSNSDDETTEKERADAFDKIIFGDGTPGNQGVLGQQYGMSDKEIKEFVKEQEKLREKKIKEELERKKKAAEEAQRKAAEEAKASEQNSQNNSSNDSKQSGDSGNQGSSGNQESSSTPENKQKSKSEKTSNSVILKPYVVNGTRYVVYDDLQGKITPKKDSKGVYYIKSTSGKTYLVLESEPQQIPHKVNIQGGQYVLSSEAQAAGLNIYNKGNNNCVNIKGKEYTVIKRSIYNTTSTITLYQTVVSGYKGPERNIHESWWPTN